MGNYRTYSSTAEVKDGADITGSFWGGSHR